MRKRQGTETKIDKARRQRRETEQRHGRHMSKKNRDNGEIGRDTVGTKAKIYLQSKLSQKRGRVGGKVEYCCTQRHW